MSDVIFSIILPVKNEGLNIKATVDSMLRTAGNIPYEIVVVDDNSEDRCCSFLAGRPYTMSAVSLVTTAGLGAPGARNAGAKAARGEILVFCDAHITVPQDWLDRLYKSFLLPGVSGVSPGIASMGNPQAVGYGQTWNDRLEVKWLPRPSGMTAVPLLPGGCQAFRREAFETVNGYDRGFKVWGHEDEEISLKMWLFGYSLYVDPYFNILHLFRPRHPYRVSMEHVNYNLLRLACSHFGGKRLASALSLLKDQKDFEKTLAEVMLSDVWEQRRDYLTRRKYDDRWFIKRFNIPLQTAGLRGEVQIL
ncbi:MAG: glycosyltransferase [Actinobacteria bacterium]|nr:glycosyltransferase [Actinomycetota bacterium]